jgi:hypothetical protein
MKPNPILFALSLALLLGGCATTRPTTAPATPAAAMPVTAAPASPAESTTPPPAVEPLADKPVADKPSPPPPMPLVETKPASIKGSEESSAMLDSLTAYVAMVDGIPITAGWFGWYTPLIIKSGPRRLTVGFVRGVFTAQAELQFVARSEGSYQVKFDTDAQLFGKNSYCEFWIVDAASGQTATKRMRVPLTRIEQASK